MLKTFTGQQKNRSAPSGWKLVRGTQFESRRLRRTVRPTAQLRTAQGECESPLTKVFSASCSKAYIISRSARLIALATMGMSV